MKLPDGTIGYYDLDSIAVRVLALLPDVEGVRRDSVEATIYVLKHRGIVETDWLDPECKQPGIRPKQPEVAPSV